MTHPKKLATDHQEDETRYTQSQLAFILACAHDIDQKLGKRPGKALKKIKTKAAYVDGKLTQLATYLDEDGKIYLVYAIGDGLSLTFSTLKYFFDICSNHAGDDALHEFMTSPAGIAAIAAEAAFIVGMSFLAARYDNDDKKPSNKYLRAIAAFIVDIWPYMREVLKIWKNILKGFRALFNILKWAHIYDPTVIVYPLALALAIPGAINQIFYAWMRKQRKNYMKDNQNLFKQIAEEDVSKRDALKNLQELNARIKRQSRYLRGLGLGTQMFSGLVYGLYLYMGILGFASFASVVLWPLAVVCGIMVVSFIAESVYVEWDYQRRLVITELKCEMMLLSKNIEAHLHAKMRGEDIPDAALRDFLRQYHQKRQLIEQKKQLSNFGAAMFGIRNGLAIYGVLCAGLFAASLIMSLASVSFPPALIVGVVIAGLACMIGYAALMIGMNMVQNKYLHQPEVAIDVEKYKKLSVTRRAEYVVQLSQNINPEKLQSPRSWAEVFRSTLSAFGKSLKNSEFMFNFLQHVGDNGHYQDSPIMFILGLAQTAFFCPVFMVRAFTKGFRDGASVDAPEVQKFEYHEPIKKQPQEEVKPYEATDAPGRDIPYECPAATATGAQPPRVTTEEECPKLTRSLSFQSFFDKDARQQSPLSTTCSETPRFTNCNS